MLKKALSIFISVLIVISLLPVLAFADTYTNPTIYADNATSTAGNTVSIAVYVANNPGVWGMDVIVSYDRAIMTLSKVTNGEIFDSSELTPGNINSPNYILSYSSNEFDNNTKSGVLATITFSINESTAAGKYTVGISYTEGNIIDCESKDVAFDTVNGSVTVEAPKCDHALSFVAEAASTCTVQGTKAHYVCSKCNALFADAEGTIETTAEALQLPLDPDNHGDGLSSAGWTKKDGENHAQICKNCQKEITEAHKWNDGVVTTPATHTEKGVKTFKCTVCEATKTEDIPTLTEHSYGDWSKLDDEYHHRTCVCGEIAYKSAHVSSDWIVDGYPNPVSIGMMHKECVICGYTLAREILPATGGVTRPAQTRQYTVTATAGDHGSISLAGKTVVKSGDNVTYVITPDEGYEIASVLVNGADIGAVREYTFWNVKSDCTISVSFREIPAAHYNPFVDVNPGDAYYDAVLYVYENGLFKGVSETEFAPDTTMTRAMFVTVLGRMAGVNPLLYQKSSFTDVEVGQWYSPYVEWAAQSGIVLGYGDGTFGLNDEITVEQAAVILARYAAFTGRSTYTLRTLSDFADSADVSDWAVYSMKWIVNTGIYTGENGMLSPKSLAKRSLVAAMLYNYAD